MTSRPQLLTDLLREKVTQALAKSGAEIPEGFSPSVTPAADLRFGDYQTNAAMVLAKQVRTNPREFAAKVVENLDVADVSAQPEIAGPGFINFRILPEEWARRLASMLEDDRLGVH